MKTPNPTSKRSKRRAARGFINLETSSRKHQRAFGRRSRKSCINNKHYSPGEKIICVKGAGSKDCLHTAGGALNFH